MWCQSQCFPLFINNKLYWFLSFRIMCIQMLKTDSSCVTFIKGPARRNSMCKNTTNWEMNWHRLVDLFYKLSLVSGDFVNMFWTQMCYNFCQHFQHLNQICSVNTCYSSVHDCVSVCQVEEDLRRLKYPTQLQLPLEQIQPKPWAKPSHDESSLNTLIFIMALFKPRTP